MGHPQNSILAKTITDASGADELVGCAAECPCSVCGRLSRPRLRRPVSVPQICFTTRCLLMFISGPSTEILTYCVIGEATRFHVTHVLRDQTASVSFGGIIQAWIRWASGSRFLSVDPCWSHIGRCFVDQLGAQATTVLVGAAGKTWFICSSHGREYGPR